MNFSDTKKVKTDYMEHVKNVIVYLEKNIASIIQYIINIVIFFGLIVITMPLAYCVFVLIMVLLYNR